MMIRILLVLKNESIDNLEQAIKLNEVKELASMKFLSYA
jgi:hypothetical protein